MIPLLSAYVSVFQGVTNKVPAARIPLADQLDRIKNGIYRQEIAQLRQLRTTQGKSAYEQAKRQLEAFTPAGVFSRRRNAGLTEASGLVHFDFDHPANLAAAKDLLRQDPWVTYAFLSPSGDGLKVAVWADGIVDDRSYKHVWTTVLDYFTRTFPDLAVANDTACKDIARLCFVSDDSDIYTNPNALLYAVPRQAAAAPPPKTKATRTTAATHAQPQPPGTSAQARVEDALQFIPAEEYDPWLLVGMALHSTGEAWARDLWDKWSQSSAKYDAAMQEQKWGSFTPNGGVTLATIFFLAKQHGYRPATLIVGSQPATASTSPPQPQGSTPASTSGAGGRWSTPAWHSGLLRQKGGKPEQTINNFALALANLEPWYSAGCWYDVVRERHMVGAKPVEDGDATAAGILIEQATQIRVSNSR